MVRMGITIMRILDPDSYVKTVRLVVGMGKRLRWPDDYFQLSADLSYQRYILKDWNYFLIANGSCNNIALNLALSRNSTDNPIYPRRGSEFTLSVGLTPPYSLFDNKDYKNLANNYQSASYDREMQEKYKWIEYHKWKFKLRTYTALSSAVKCPVLMTRVEFGLLGAYNKYKKSPLKPIMSGRRNVRLLYDVCYRNYRFARLRQRFFDSKRIYGLCLRPFHVGVALSAHAARFNEHLCADLHRRR